MGSFLFRIAAAVALSCGLLGCSREAAPADAPATPEPASPRSRPISEKAERPTPERRIEAVPAARATPRADDAPATPAPLRQAQAPTAEESPAALENRFFQPATTLEERGQILDTLGTIGTSAAAEVISHIFQREKRQELRMQALQVANDLPDETCREQKFALFTRATAPTLSQIVRLSAMQTLIDMEDARVPATLRTLSGDRDPVIRQFASEALKNLSQ